MVQQIKTEITCQNLAPLSNFSAEILSDTLKLAIFANNGSGKTFLSRMFRLAEKQYQFSSDESGKRCTDKLISFEKTKCDFMLKITDKQNKVVEDFCINVSKGIEPIRPSTYYIYHCFNQDFVDENIRKLSFQKDKNVVGYILGKANIDVNKEKEDRFKKEVEQNKLIETIKNKISLELRDKIDNLPNIKRLIEYQNTTYHNLSAETAKPYADISKSYTELISDYNKVKSVPENLQDIKPVSQLEISTEIIADINTTLNTPYTLSTFAAAFKEKVKAKQGFVEAGLGMIQDKTCPFCEQSFNAAASELIDQYTLFISDEESATIKKLNQYKDALRTMVRQLKSLQAETNERMLIYNEYVSSYLPSLADTETKVVEIEEPITGITAIAKQIEYKILSIEKPISIPAELVEKLEEQITACLDSITKNNQLINTCNQRIKGIDQESKDVRRMLCKICFNDLLAALEEDLESSKVLGKELTALDKDIREKEEKQKVSKKQKVFDTVKKVLQYFFGNKYTLDEENFRLILNQKILDEGQAKDVLSEGEKNVIAFAYFIGDIHLKIDKEDDYSKLFFIIDDPISSMDFNHVYSICGIIRNLKELINMKSERFIIFTHNLDFMRVLSGNNIASKSFLLKDAKLWEFNHNLTVPYISHLHDIYQVAKGTRLPSHTTANSIRHVIESLNKFENIDVTTDLISKYIKDNVPNESKTYTLINDLSHGGWRTEQAPVHEQDFIAVCETIVTLIEKKYKGQIDYCVKLS
jgi:wobble nucleotide-excising tRNase